MWLALTGSRRCDGTHGLMDGRCDRLRGAGACSLFTFHVCLVALPPSGPESSLCVWLESIATQRAHPPSFRRPEDGAPRRRVQFLTPCQYKYIHLPDFVFQKSLRKRCPLPDLAGLERGAQQWGARDRRRRHATQPCGRGVEYCRVSARETFCRLRVQTATWP